MTNQPYKIISKETKNSLFGNKNDKYDKYILEINDETHLNFRLKTLGYVLVEEDDELDFDKIGHYFHYIDTEVYNDKGKLLTNITGTRTGDTYIPKKSIIKAKDWLNKRGDKLLLGKKYQHKST